MSRRRDDSFRLDSYVRHEAPDRVSIEEAAKALDLTPERVMALAKDAPGLLLTRQGRIVVEFGK